MFGNLYKGNDSALFQNAQVPKANNYVVAVDRARGMRFGLARRLLAACEGRDILAPDLSRRLKKGDKAAYRWESGEDRPRDKTVEAFATICQAAGLPITASWLERGETDLPLIAIPAAALVPPPLPEKPEESVFRRDKVKREPPRQRKKHVPAKKQAGGQG